jgi:hypothetical protein
MAKSGLKHIDVGNELTKTEWESEDSHELVHGSAFPGTPVERQLFYRDDEHKWYIYNGAEWVWLGGGSGSGATTFLQLTDTPASYEGHAGKVAQVKATEDGLEFSAAAGGMAVHGNEYHDPDFEQAGVAASLIASHAAIDDAHHSRYTDAEAEAVAETEVESHRTTEVHSLAQPPQTHGNTAHSPHFEEEGVAIPKSLLTARGDIIYRDASAPARLAKGTEGHFLRQGANDPYWGSLANIIDKTHLSQDFGAGSGRLLRFDATPTPGNAIVVLDASEDSPFSAKINAGGSGGLTSTNVPYDNDLKEGMFAGLYTYDGSDIWAQVLLHNTTRGNFRKIVSVDISNNVITTSASTDDWADDDDITVLSPTVGGGGLCDLDLSAKLPASAYAILLWVFLFDKSTTYNADRELELHPYESLDSGKKRLGYFTQAGMKLGMTVILPVIDQRICFRISGSNDFYFSIKSHGYWEYADT